VEPQLGIGVRPTKRNPWILCLIGLSTAFMFALLLHAWSWAAALRGSSEQEGAYFFAGLGALMLGAPTSVLASLLLDQLEPLLVRLGITSLQFVLGAMVVNWALIGFMIGWWNKRRALQETQRRSTS
jgi:hypothetical protein